MLEFETKTGYYRARFYQEDLGLQSSGENILEAKIQSELAQGG